jgi:lysyl endopeptidase
LNSRNALYLALFSMLSGTALAAPQEMNTEPVAAVPQAGRLGAAELQSAKLGRSISTQVVNLAAPNGTQLSALKQGRIQQIKLGLPLQIGFSRNVAEPAVNLSKLDWQIGDDGSRVATMKITSAGAASLRAALQLSGVGGSNPGRVTLRFAGDDGRVFEQSGEAFSDGQNGWSPAVQGATLLVEIVLPAGLYPENFNLKIPQLSHIDIAPNASASDIITKAVGDSDSCENDVVCRSNPSAGYINASKAVARMVFTMGTGSFLCTGTLLNNNNTPKRALFWTAAHCISTQSAADTLQTYWFYDATTCNGGTVSPSMVTLSGGAYLRHADTTRDTALLELKSTPPAGAFYAGWNSAAIAAAGTAVEGIHHPAGDVKKYSLGTVTTTSTTTKGKSPLYRVVWSDGSTEGGSSGSALFTNNADNYQLRGGLYGGTASCTAPSKPDFYSNFSQVYPMIKSYLGE